MHTRSGSSSRPDCNRRTGRRDRRERLAALLGAVALAGAVTGCAAAPTERSLRGAAEALDAAIRDRDRGRMERLVAPEFVQVRGAGQQIDRSRYIGDLVGAAAAPGDSRSAIRLVKVTAGAGIVAGDVEYARRAAPPLVALYADTWIFRGGQWSLIFEQLAVVPDAAQAPRATDR